MQHCQQQTARPISLPCLVVCQVVCGVLGGPEVLSHYPALLCSALVELLWVYGWRQHCQDLTLMTFMCHSSL
jgi:hypothetical protein